MNVIKLLRSHPQLLRIWLAQIFSQSASKIYQIAILWWLVNEQKSSSIEVAIFLIANALPYILFSKRIGVLVEKTPSQKVLISADYLAAITTMIITVLFATENFQFGHAVIFGFLLATFQALFDPCLQKSIPELVDSDLDQAVSLIASTQSIASFLGAILGSGLLTFLNYSQVSVLNSASFVLSAIMISILVFRSRTPAEGESSSEPLVLTSQLNQILWGFAAVNFFLTPVLLILPIYTDRILHRDVGSLSLLEAAVWLGTIVGTLVAPALKISNKIQFSSLVFYVAGALLILPGIIHSFALYFSILLIVGASLGTMNTLFLTFFHEVIPHHQKGRFFALLMALVTASFPLSFFLFGILLDRLSIEAVCLFQGIGLFLMGPYFYRLAKQPRLAEAT